MWLSGALNRFILLMMLPAVLVIAPFPPGEVFPPGELLESMYLAGGRLTMLVLEVRSYTMALAVIDDGGITYADGWRTNRVSFGDVAAWHRDPTRHLPVHHT